MMDVPLLTSSIITYAARFNGDQEIVSRAVEGGIHRYTYRDAAARSAQLANALRALGVLDGMRIATIAWNTYRHFELYYAVGGIGAVCHTINPRLHPGQIAYIVNHADDRYVFVDLTFVPLVEALAPHLPRVRGYVIMTDEAHMPQTSLPNALCYETLLAAQPATIEWPSFDENTACGLCYTSGTTGDPKGVLYSHRAMVLHAMNVGVATATRRNDSSSCIMPIVPLFHVNGWGIPYAGPMMGSKLVFTGPAHDPASIYELMEGERVASAAGVPVIWLGLLAYLQQTGKELTALKSMSVGGSAAPASLIEWFESRGIEVIHGWGMTETSPVCTNGSLKPKHRGLPWPERLNLQRRAGRCAYGVEMKIVDEEGNTCADDGESQGELYVRGPWIANAYYNNAEATANQFTDDGWFRTGDICSIDADGYLTIHDRAKDLIKSGGEWISSIDLENAAVAHPELLEAAAIAIPHDKWAERPLLVAVRKPGSAVGRDDVLAFLDGKVAKWWLPDDVVFVDEMPHTATGKISKRTLRARYANGDFALTGARAAAAT
ncbi:MAG TPA: long-chain fatty acid--CoA ligase [Candidatus Baltobacteraceae bacterium]|nr:long-chain fatty acid--CoA ligase [Candidatus Baltobacteraceae bacterium]